MLFPVALTHATEEINWIRILFCTGDVCLPLPPPGLALFKAKIPRHTLVGTHFSCWRVPPWQELLAWSRVSLSPQEPDLGSQWSPTRQGKESDVIWCGLVPLVSPRIAW